MRRLGLMIPTVLTLLVFITFAAIGESPLDQAKKEIDTAIYHGKASTDASDLGLMKSHLKHVINCIEGPGGENFDSSEANPCKGQGNGIIPDLQSAGSEGAEALGHVQEADKIAASSAGVSDLHTLHGNVDDIVNHLAEAKKALGK